MAKQTLESWIREAMVDEDKDGECSVITLMHIGQAGEKEVHTVRFGAKAHDPTALARLFKHKAEGYGSEMAGVQQFCLCAFYKNRDNGQVRSEPEARHPFIINGELDYGGLATEGPTSHGQMSQMMRHNEVLTQTYLRGNANLIDALSALNSQLVTMNTKLMTEQHSMMEVFKTVIVERATDERKARMEALEYQRSSQERAKWIGMLPPLVNNMFGREVFPVGTEASSIIEGLSNLDETKLKQIASMLPPEVWAPLASLLEKMLRDKREQEEKTEELGGKVNPLYELGNGVSKEHVS
jgi:hypothetical protein